MTSELNGLYLGYDPGGIGQRGSGGANGVAAIVVDGGRVISQLCCTKSAVSDVLTWCGDRISGSSGSPVRGIGVDTLVYWGIEWKGLRGADCWLRHAYDEVKTSVVESNALYGAMSLNGMMVLQSLRQDHPRLSVTETHPKVLYYALCGRRYGGTRLNCLRNEIRQLRKEKPMPTKKIKTRKQLISSAEEEGLDEMKKWLANVMGLSSVTGDSPKNLHEWDALISAWAAWRARAANWEDLIAHEERIKPDRGHLRFPVERVEYRWPTTGERVKRVDPSEWDVAWEEQTSRARQKRRQT